MASVRDQYSLGKKCAICGGKVLNSAKVLTCQNCRAKQAEQRKEIKAQ